MRPYVYVSDAGMASIASISRKFVSPFGFSNGIAELTLKKPPPLVPSSLMISCEATGPHCDSDCTTPWEASTSAPTIEIGSSTYSSARVRSCQKLPRPSAPARRAAMPRISAIATTMPTAAETKFCTARPAIWLKNESVVSPP